MTQTRILYGVEHPKVRGELKDDVFEKLNVLDLISPCHSCTQYLNEDDTVVYHPNVSARPAPEVEAEIIACAVSKPN